MQSSRDHHVTSRLYITSYVIACLFLSFSSASDPRLWIIQLYRLHTSFLPCLCLDWLSSQHYLKLILLFFSPEKEFKYIYEHLQTTNRTRTGQNLKDKIGPQGQNRTRTDHYHWKIFFTRNYPTPVPLCQETRQLVN